MKSHALGNDYILLDPNALSFRLPRRQSGGFVLATMGLDLMAYSRYSQLADRLGVIGLYLLCFALQAVSYGIWLSAHSYASLIILPEV